MLGAFSLFSGVELMGIYSIFSRMTQFSIDRINQIKNMPKIDDTSGYERPRHFDVAFENVTFAYESKPVLENISFTVPEKTTTALVGLSGSGKTTIYQFNRPILGCDTGKGTDWRQRCQKRSLRNPFEKFELCVPRCLSL
jgi:ABC-type multidrug transport system fused ATPase/permease subunit